MSQPRIDKQALAPRPAAAPPGALPLPAWADLSGEAGAAEMPFSFYLMLVKRYRWRIMTFVMLVTALTTLVALVLTKQYRSTAILRIDPNGIRTVGERGNSSGISMSAHRLLTTESDLITSPAVVLTTINELRLYRYKEFAPPRLGKAAALTPAQMNLVLKSVTGEISVTQPLNSYLLDVSFRSFSPELSARVANSLVHNLVRHDYNTRLRALIGSSRSMRAELTGLRAKMERSQEALVQYESTHDVLNPESKTNIMVARLGQVNQDLGTAQTQRFALQADYEIVKSGNLDALIASDRGKYLLPLYTRLLNDRRHLARMGEVYGPNYPLYRQQQGLVKNDSHVLVRQEKHIARQIRSQYAMARVRERMLRAELQVQKKRMDFFNLKAIRYFALKAASDSYTKLYYQLQQRIQDATVAANLHAESLRLISPARPEQIPVFPRPLLTAFLAFVLSTFLAVGCAIAYGVMDKSISSPEQIEMWFQIPVLTSLPQVEPRDKGKLLPVGYGPRLLQAEAGADLNRAHEKSKAHGSAFRESILALHSAIMLSRDQDLHTLSITSAIPSEGKSTVAANLAAAFAGLGSRTVLMDLDMRKPSMHRQFKIANRRGASSLLRGQCGLDQVLVDAPDVPNLSLIPAGPAPSSPTELLHLGLADWLEQLRIRYEYILLDCPPILGFADTLAVANLVEGCLLVVRAGETERQLVSASLRQLRSARAQILGVALNNVHEDLGSYYSYYSHYYKYQSTASEEPADGGGSHEE